MNRRSSLSRLFFITTIAFCSLTLSSAFADTDRGIQIKSGRYALVIGNGAYPISPLKNPVNDAEDMALSLRKLGFTVMHRHDVGIREMETAVREFGRMLKGGGTGMFYYAGHGMQVDGRNYLIPVDARIESESDVRYEALDMGRVLGKMEDAGNNLNLVILDACRNNPFARAFRSARSGLARMDAPRGTLIAYATAPGSVAADGTERNGLYTKNLLAHMATPGLSAEQVFKNVRIDVIRDSNQKQVPWESSSLTGNFYFAPPASQKRSEPDVSANSGGPSGKDGMAYEIVFWESIKDANDPALFRAYLQKYPNGAFSEIARIKSQRAQPAGVQKISPVPAAPKTKEPSKPLLAYARDEKEFAEIELRSVGRHIANQSEIDAMVIQHTFYDAARNPRGNYRSDLSKQNDDTAIDGRTRLMWQRGGSGSKKSFLGAKAYIKKLNKDGFAGYSDWRLPTIEELASIIEATRTKDMHISQVFNQRQTTCWSSDTTDGIHNYTNEYAAWIVDFKMGQIEKANWWIKPGAYEGFEKDEHNHVRAVRSVD